MSAMPKQVQEQMITELIDLYKQGAAQADNKIDAAITKTFGTSLVKALEETQILAVDPIGWTDSLKKEFIDRVLLHVKVCLDEITATWTPDWQAVLYSNFDDRKDYIQEIVDYMQVKIAEAQPTMH